MAKRKFVSLSIFLLFFISAFAQNNEEIIKRSNNKVVIGGIAYYVHIVKKGDTLFGLSKMYNISKNEIAKENPEIFLGLQIGQALKIPVKPQIDKKIRYFQSNKYINHKVKKKQTLFFLSKKYNVSQEEIIALNPGVEYGLDINQIVKIPKKTSRKIRKEKNQKYTNIDTINTYASYIKHKVDSLETFYSLSKEYKISEEDIISANPILIDGLKYGQVINIPSQIIPSLKSDMFISEYDSIPESPYLNNEYYSFPDSAEINCEAYLHFKTFNIAVFLPFSLNENSKTYSIDSTEFDNFGKKIYKRKYFSPYYIYKPSINFIEFYEGLLIAADSLRNHGMSINLFAYDTKNDSININNILHQPKFADIDLIIGPIFNNKFEIVADFAHKNNINIVSPVMSNSDVLKQNSNFFQVFPSNKAQINLLTSNLFQYCKDYKNYNIVLIHSGDSLQYEKNEYVKNKLSNFLKPNTFSVNDSLLWNDSISNTDSVINNIQFKEVVFADSINTIIHALRKDENNVIIIPSNNQAFVSDLVTKLNYISTTFEYNIKLFGMNKWQRFNNIEPDYYYNLNLTIQSPFYIDYKKEKVKDFVLKYRDEYKSEPSQFAFHGFDVGYYFFNALFNYGEEFNSCINNYNINLLQTNYKFVKLYKDSGFENIAGTILNYNDKYYISVKE